MSFIESICRPAGLASLLIVSGYSGLVFAAPQGPVTLNVPPAIRSMAAKPVPPVDARKVTTIGAGQLQASTSNGPADTDFLWKQKIDITGDDRAEDAQLLWDDDDSILYVYGVGKLACSRGGETDAGVLVLVYGNANKVQQATGSGAYVVQLGGGQCGAKAAGLSGCTFNPKGNSTACGAAVLDQTTGDLKVTAAPR